MKDFIIYKKLYEYLHKMVGVRPSIWEIEQAEQKVVPFYLKETYWMYYGDLFFGNEFTLLIPKHELPKVSQIKKNMETIEDLFHRRTALVYNTIPSYIRHRLIQKQINFIVPGWQMFMPNIRVDLNEKEYKRPEKTEKLIPSAQLILLHQILKPDDNLEKLTFKQLAEKFNYSAMAITKAINNLKVHELCETEGNKEKFIRFNYENSELWFKALALMTSPVLKQVYIENHPGEDLFMANTTALPEYTDMNPSKQHYFAIEKNKYYKLEKENKLQGLNKFEGQYCLEIWKYDPSILSEEIAKEAVVDPLSLYLTFTDNKDERIEMALEQIIKRYIYGNRT